ncbi:tetratricopeptide repeat protein [Atopomonas sediminilitoris]|uniref:tetratricopeptide repeat protein n=1 Tax=Atopomonas sediminilitoris TaxID=2919919 RepID=UPI001F4E569F|nr:tetratricopeptide repeat protein [Atopomonas sediminilitoris]MCJ8168929.1 tetratricopeptide repeat protein [Atopomonas sediminilitoris]
MPSSTVTERPRLFSLGGLLLVSVVVLVALLFAFPRQDVLQPHDGDTVDGVSLMYAELMLRSSPDPLLRVQLIEQLLVIDDLVRAREHLLQLPSKDPATAYLWLELAVKEVMAEPEKLDLSLKRQLLNQMQALLPSTLSTRHQEKLASLALAIGFPGVAAQLYEQLAEGDSLQRRHWLTQAARWFRASGDEAAAAEIYQRLLSHSDDAGERQAYRLDVFLSLVAAGKGPKALRWLDTELVNLMANELDIELLQAGLREAQANSDFARARLYLQRWHALQPDDEQWLARAFALNLAAGFINDAWSLGLQLMQQQEVVDEPLLRQMAQLGEWVGKPYEALPLWIDLAKRSGQAADYDHAWRLAAATFSYDVASDLLIELARLQRLNDEELSALVFVNEERGEPEVAHIWLQGYLLRYPQERTAWLKLIQLNENMQQLSLEAVAFSDMSRHVALTVHEYWRWADLHWRMFDAEQAWAVLLKLDSQPNLLSLADDGFRKQYWLLRAELAWVLEYDDAAESAFEQLLALNGKLTRDHEERLLELYRVRNPKKALALALKAWRERGDLRLLLVALQLAEQLADWVLLAELVEEIHEKNIADSFAGEPLFWMIQGRLAEQTGDLSRAQALYLSMVSRFPGNPLVQERYLWFLLDNQLRDSLPSLLRKWQNSARTEQRLWLPFAAGYSLIGQYRDSLNWYQLHIQSRPDDLLGLSAYADTLELAGWSDSAWRIRQHLMAKWKVYRLQVDELLPEEFNTYLRLVNSLLGPAASRRVAEIEAQQGQRYQGMLLAYWFEQWLDQLSRLNEAGQLEPWLQWAEQRNIKQPSFIRLQSALRRKNKAQLWALLQGNELRDDEKAEIALQLGYDMRAVALASSALSDEGPASRQATLRSQAQAVLDRHPQGVQVAFGERDFGGLTLDGPRLTIARGQGEGYWRLDQQSGSYHGDALDSAQMGNEQHWRGFYEYPLKDGHWLAGFDSSWRADSDRAGLFAERQWRYAEEDQVTLGVNWRVTTDETGLLYALGYKEGLFANGSINVSARDQLSWRGAYNQFYLRDGDKLGHGWQGGAEWAHTVLYKEPHWILRTGLSWQENQRQDQLPDDLLAANGGVLRLDEPTPADLLPARFGEIYVGSLFKRGIPGHLNRYMPQFTWLVDTQVGYQWPERSIAYNVNVGLGVEVLGDDELALMYGYSSAPSGGGGEAGGQWQLTYSTRFGR